MSNEMKFTFTALSIIIIVFHFFAYSAISQQSPRDIQVEYLKKEWVDFLTNKGPEAKYLQICTSDGSISVEQALSLVPESIRQRIIVLAIAPATVIPKELCFESYNYASKYDFIPYLNDITSKVEYRNQLQSLESHPNGSCPGYSFLDPIFDAPKEDHITEFIEKDGGIK